MKVRTKMAAVVILAIIFGWIYLIFSPRKPLTKDELQKSELKLVLKAQERCRDLAYDPKLRELCEYVEYRRVHDAYKELHREGPGQ